MKQVLGERALAILRRGEGVRPALTTPPESAYGRLWAASR